MPRTHIYKGLPGFVGRFGFTKVGDHVDLHLDEELNAMSSGDFEPLSEQELPEKIIPLRGRATYDLRHIDWSSRHAASYIRSMSRHTVLNIAVAMNELGLRADVFEHNTIDDIVDNIRRAARAHGWDTLTPQERGNCPAPSRDEEEASEGSSEGQDTGEQLKPDAGDSADTATVQEEEPSAEEEKEVEPPVKGPARKRAHK